MIRKIINPDYIYFTMKPGRRSEIALEEREIAGIKILEVNYFEKNKKVKEEKEQNIDSREKVFKRIQRKLKKYDLQNCVIGATEEMAELLEMKDLLFQARKLEFLKHGDEIFKNLKVEGKEGKRSSVLLKLNSSKWNAQDVLTILVTAKDYYEDVVVMMEEEYLDAEQLQNVMYEDWGVMLYFVEEEIEADFELTLSERWEAKSGTIYLNLAYERAGLRLPYQMAVNIAAQNPALYEDFQISIVAIYGQEW